MKEDLLAGKVLLVDKPYGWTSFDVVNKIKTVLRHEAGIKKIKIGHAGTLDPLATGLLIICTGKATKAIDQYQDQSKTYTGSFQLGQTTPSFDLETEPENRQPITHLTEEDLHQAASQLTGSIDQLPPIYSAKKINGERAYSFARKGTHTDMKTKRVVIHAFDITGIDWPVVDFRVSCSKGTYIRSLAKDFGELLGCGAYLRSLRRTHIGDFSVDDAWQIQELTDYIRETAR